ncbi:MAG: DUF3109 family protein [Flavobacteriales bacterium]|nr:DUF3109 family protein [Flavobacteriales bacterium]MCB9174710.1 DUF3109 family protein [Flavobacteriales bacterium]
MIQIQDTIVSELLLDKKFVCNLNACKGACCIEGDAGAPLEENELEELENVFPHVKEYLTQESINALEQDLYTIDTDGDFVTQLVNNKACAFVFLDDKKVAKCSIEQAFLDGKVSFKKPISCHLFPVRIKSFKSFLAVNYEEIEICSDACTLGKELGVKTYQFLKEPLIRRFGEEWFNELELVDKHLNH